MDKRQRLEGLNKQDAELRGKFEELKKTMTLDNNYEEYEQCSSDEERKQKFPELYALYEQLKEIDEKRDTIIEEIDSLELEIEQEEEINTSNQHYEEVKQKIEKLEMEFKLNQEEHARLNDECKERLKEISKLKDSKPYKDGDEETVKKVQELDAILNKKVMERIALADGVKSKRKEIDELEQEIQAYINEGKEKYKELENKIKEAKEAQIKRYDEYVKLMADYDKEYESKLAEIASLKNSKEYKDGDEEAIKKVEQLQAELEEIDNKRSEAGKNLNEKAKETNGILKDLEKQKEMLVEQYGKDIISSEPENSTVNHETKSDNREQDVGETVQAADGENKDQSDTESGKNTRDNKNINRVRSGASNVAVSSPAAEREDDISKELFKELYAKAKSGELNQKDFEKLAKIMQDPSKYEEYGITTGKVFNKAKVIFKAMGARATKNANTIKLCEEKFGIKYEKASRENGLLNASELKNWKGLQTLIENPDTKIASEELFKQVVQKDRESLSDEEKVVWDAAKERLGRFEAMRCSLEAYRSVTKEREQTKHSWFLKFSKQSPKALSSAPVASKPHESKPVTLSDTLATHVVGENDTPSTIPPATQAPPTRSDR